jgi:hypothetical protein
MLEKIEAICNVFRVDKHENNWFYGVQESCFSRETLTKLMEIPEFQSISLDLEGMWIKISY